MSVSKVVKNIIVICLVCSMTGCDAQMDTAMSEVNSMVSDIKVQLENDTKINELRMQVGSLLDVVKFDEFKNAVTTEKPYEDTQTAQFVNATLHKPFQCEYVRMSGNVVGSSDFAYHKGIIVKTEEGYYIEEIQVSQNFEGVSDIVNKNVWVCGDATYTTGEEATTVGTHMYNLLEMVPQKLYYKENKVTNLVNVSDCDIDLFSNGTNSTYAYFYNADAVLSSIVIIETQDVITFSDFKTDNLMDVSEYFNK